MPNKMLIDASHPEETRVVVTRGNRIEEFDFESQAKKQLRGNIYLARVTRVEPSLQAAFVEYGGNRHGFLAFSEIHPDYYQIPVADRQALLQAEAEEVRAEDARADEEESHAGRGRGRHRRSGRKAAEAASGDDSHDGNEPDDNGEDTDGDAIAASADSGDTVSEEISDNGDHSGSDDNGKSDTNGSDENAEVDTVGAEDAMDEAHHRRRSVRRHYKIQEVIKRRQILLVQVVKEERGNKGAALTTYLSLAGRYSVLMPNTARGGGISRKITSLQDRKRLKDIVRELEVPQGMGVILRTAGANRTRAEIKRDYEYLMRLWEKVRSLTLESTAPTLVYEEGSLVKRSIRDLYNKDIDEILVAGEEGYREAKDFMRMLMPSHAKVVQPYRDTVPILARSGIEGQLDKMVQPQVTLKSGGYIIINQTEALVAIDVNSGRSTKEHSIEDTALQTNLEAAEEVARHLRLRDLAGLIVIDFIDMEENRNNRAVEKKLKDCLKNDRARIQVGRISHFGLLEMSRQRIRASVLESTMQPCPHCGGTGHIRSESSVGLMVVRAIEEFLIKESRNDIAVRTPPSTALYVLNNKRSNLVALEQRFGVRITIEADEDVGSQHYVIVKGALAEKSASAEHVAFETPFSHLDEEAEAQADEAAAKADEAAIAAQDGDHHEDDDGSGHDRKKRRRRRRRGGRDRHGEEDSHDESGHDEAGQVFAGDDSDAHEDAEGDGDAATQVAAEDGDEKGERKKRRRGKRGGKRNRRDDGSDSADLEAAETDSVEAAGTEAAQVEAAGEPAAASQAETNSNEEPTDAIVETSPAVDPEPESAPKEKAPARRRAPRKPKKSEQDAAETVPAEASDDMQIRAEPEVKPEPEPQPQIARPAPNGGVERKAASTRLPVSEPIVSSTAPEDEAKPRRTGWWQRKGFF